MSSGGKGSKPRPISVPRKQFDNNWERIFGKKKKEGQQKTAGQTSGQVTGLIIQFPLVRIQPPLPIHLRRPPIGSSVPQGRLCPLFSGRPSKDSTAHTQVIDSIRGFPHKNPLFLGLRKSLILLEFLLFTTLGYGSIMIVQGEELVPPRQEGI